MAFGAGSKHPQVRPFTEMMVIPLHKHELLMTENTRDIDMPARIYNTAV